MDCQEQGKYQCGKIVIDEKFLKDIGKVLISYFDDFSIYKMVVCQFENKKKMFESGKVFDWVIVEVLVFGLF